MCPFEYLIGKEVVASEEKTGNGGSIEFWTLI